jgi:hypothetical protein
MSNPSQHPGHFSTHPRTEPSKNGAARHSALQAKPAGLRPLPAAQEIARPPAAPPAYRPQPTPRAAQAKLRATVQLTPAPTARNANGVIQANIVGGTQALQARLALLRAPVVQQARTQTSSTAQLKAGSNFKHAPAPARPERTQTIQRKSGSGVEAFQVPLQAKSGGQPLPDQVRAKMESAFGMDFSDVRIHVGQEASAIGAIAYTWGTNIHFAPGQYSPHTIQGQKLLGHELWHVVQQKSGRVSNPFGSGVAVVQDHALEAEADRMGVKAAMTVLVQKPGGER